MFNYVSEVLSLNIAFSFSEVFVLRLSFLYYMLSNVVQVFPNFDTRTMSSQTRSIYFGLKKIYKFFLFVCDTNNLILS